MARKRDLPVLRLSLQQSNHKVGRKARRVEWDAHPASPSIFETGGPP